MRPGAAGTKSAVTETAHGRIVIVGAGMAGLSAAISLSAAGGDIVLLDKTDAPGGKMREIKVAGVPIDSGPTVFTMRDVFDALLEPIGVRLDDHVQLSGVNCLARHVWPDGAQLDLFADIEASAEAIAAFSDRENADGYRRFCIDSAAMFETLQSTFIAAERPNPISLARRIGPWRLDRMSQLRPFSTLWAALGDYFSDPRLRQLFGRYATYCGSSPFDAPATLMLVAHVEQAGVWLVDGGMHALACALADIATALGVDVRYGSDVAEVLGDGSGVRGVGLSSGEVIDADSVIHCGDVSALATGQLGELDVGVAEVPPPERSLSAMTWSTVARTSGVELTRHNVFFSDDYPAEFDAIFKDRRVPDRPTVYVCAQDRDDAGQLVRIAENDGRERLLILINAPADGDQKRYSTGETKQWMEKTIAQLKSCGLTLDAETMDAVATTPGDFGQLYPGTGGALYGRASHGWAATFRRPGARTKVPGLYLAGGSVHPGPGVPMAAMSGRLAAAALLADRTSKPRFRPAAIVGGTSTA